MECGGAMDKASLSPTSNAPPSPYSDCTAAAFYGSQSPSSASAAGLGLLGVAGLGCAAAEAFAAAAAGDIPNDPGKMFIGGLSWQTTPESIREYFSLFGELAEVMVMKDPATRRSRGFGFITFSDPSSVEKVLSFPVHQLDGKIIEPRVAVPRKTNPKLVMRTKKIFVGGLSATTSLDDVRMYFEQFAKVKDAMLAYDKVTNRHRGFGFVTFDNDEVVDKICEIHFHEINGKMVESKKALPKEPRGLTGGYGGAGGAGGPPFSSGRQHLMGLALGRAAFGGFGLAGPDVGYGSPNAYSAGMRGATSETPRNFDNAYYGGRIQQHQQQHHMNGDLQQQQRGYYSKYSQYMNDRNNSNTSYVLNGNDANHFNCSSSGDDAENNLDDFPPLSNINYNRNAGLISL